MPQSCRKCKKPLTRIQRKPWMHRIPGSKYYECRQCNYVYLLFFNRWLLKRKQIRWTAASSPGS